MKFVKLLLFLTLVLGLFSSSEAQEDQYNLKADKMPFPVGGMESIMKKIKYPEIARLAGIEGKVFVEAYIDEKGDVVKTKITKGIGQNVGIDEAAADAIKQTKFSAAVNNGIPVKSVITIPVEFKLDNKNSKGTKI